MAAQSQHTQTQASYWIKAAPPCTLYCTRAIHVGDALEAVDRHLKPSPMHANAPLPVVRVVAGQAGFGSGAL